MINSAIIVAGGTGTRMGSSLPKQFLLLNGKPIIIHTVEKFLQYDPALLMAVVIHPSTKSYWEEVKSKYLSAQDSARIFTCEGGASRTASVHNGLALLHHHVPTSSACLVAIHDAVRPFVSHDMLTAAYHTAATHGAAVCCVPVKSSIREQTSAGSKAVDRTRFFHVQTPQVFKFSTLYQAYLERSHDQFTDDASLWEAAGEKVEICPGSYDNIKLTTPEDLFVAEMILKKRSKRT